MKIQNRIAGTNTVIHFIERPGVAPILVTLQALPLGFNDLMESRLPSPQPPLEFVKDASGGWVRDENDRAVTYGNTRDAKYRQALEEHRTLRLYFQLVHALAGDPSVQIDAKVDAFETTADYLRAVAREMKDFGFSDGEIYAMVAKVQKLNAGHVERVEHKAEGFLPGAPAPADGNCPTTAGAANAT